MSKKDFVALADAVRGVDDLITTPLGEHIVDALVRFCLSQNPRFNEARWRDYLAGKCGPNGGAK